MGPTFIDSFAPPVRSQHEAIEAATATGRPVQLVLDVAPPACPLPARLRTRLLQRIHPTATILERSGSFGEVIRSAAQPLEAADEARRFRRDPERHWSLIHPITQGELTVRVCCIGAESTGKTTLVDALAARYGTHRIGEFGRDYTVRKKDEGTNDHWTTDDFIEIAQEQQRLEDEAAVGAGPLLFCDTDAMTTALWHERYQGYRSAEVEAIGRTRAYDLFVLCDVDIPWERDEIRLGADTRHAMHQRFLEVLTRERTEPWVLVSGSVERRIATVEARIEELGLLTAGSMFAPARFANR